MTETKDNIIAAFEWAFWVLFVIGLLSTTIYIEFQFPISGILIMLCAGLLLALARVVRAKQNVPYGNQTMTVETARENLEELTPIEPVKKEARTRKR